MNNLDLTAYGVSEMTKQEMQETNGGFFSVFVAYMVGLGIGLIVSKGVLSAIFGENESFF